MNAVTYTVRRHPLSVEDCHRMAENGVFAPDARVEPIYDMAPITPASSIC